MPPWPRGPGRALPEKERRTNGRTFSSRKMHLGKWFLGLPRNLVRMGSPEPILAWREAEEEEREMGSASQEGPPGPSWLSIFPERTTTTTAERLLERRRRASPEARGRNDCLSGLGNPRHLKSALWRKDATEVNERGGRIAATAGPGGLGKASWAAKAAVRVTNEAGAQRAPGPRIGTAAFTSVAAFRQRGRVPVAVAGKELPCSHGSSLPNGSKEMGTLCTHLASWKHPLADAPGNSESLFWIPSQ